MSRDGFAIADTDTGLMADAKVLALARLQRDPIRTAAAITLYEAVRLASWKEGRRLTLDDTLPGWWLDPIDDLADALVAVKLLDAERRIPEHAWEGWYVPALERRLTGRRGSMFGGLRRQGLSVEEANAEVDRRIHGAGSSVKAEAKGSSVKAQPEGSASYKAQPPTDRPSVLPSVRPSGPDKDEEDDAHGIAPKVGAPPRSPAQMTDAELASRLDVLPEGHRDRFALTIELKARQAASAATNGQERPSKESNQTVDCRDYSGHQSRHVKGPDGVWRCEVCTNVEVES